VGHLTCEILGERSLSSYSDAIAILTLVMFKEKLEQTVSLG